MAYQLKIGWSTKLKIRSFKKIVSFQLFGVVTYSWLGVSKPFVITCSLKFKFQLEDQNIFGRSLINMEKSKGGIWFFFMRIHEGDNQTVAFGLSQQWIQRIKIINMWQLIIIEKVWFRVWMRSTNIIEQRVCSWRHEDASYVFHSSRGLIYFESEVVLKVQLSIECDLLVSMRRSDCP